MTWVVRCSGGQKQRVLLARALYKKPKLLFLDEATSHLDAQRESLINDAIKQLPLTRIIVAHRADTIAAAGRVVELVGGRVVNDSRDRLEAKEHETVGRLDAVAA